MILTDKKIADYLADLATLLVTEGYKLTSHVDNIKYLNKDNSPITIKLKQDVLGISVSFLNENGFCLHKMSEINPILLKVKTQVEKYEKSEV